MLLKRWITSIVALPLFLLLLLKGGTFLFFLFICLICMIALWEYYKILFYKNPGYIRDPLIILGFPVSISILYFAYLNNFTVIFEIILLNFLISGVFAVMQFKDKPNSPVSAAFQISGIIYISLFLALGVIIRNNPDGIAWIGLILCLMIASDAGAYYFGTYLGRNKLIPSVSPNKTIEGSIGGLFLAIAAGIAYRHYFIPEIHLGYAIILFIITIIAGQVGDLFTSMLKRFGDIKDSGNIIPGHGGILDRLDSILFALPVVFILKKYISVL